MKRDLLILSYLRHNSRMKLTDMSRESRIPVSTLFDRIVDFERRGIIRRLTSLVKFESFGYRGKALAVFSADKKDKVKLLQLLECNRNVNSLYKINNGWDFMAELVFPGLKEVEDFVEGLEEQVVLKNKKVFYIIDELKREIFMADPKTVRLPGGLS